MKQHKPHPSQKLRMPGIPPSLAISLLYLLFGLLWFFFSDRIASDIAISEEQPYYFSNINGWLFVFVTALLLYLLLLKTFRKQEAARLRLNKSNQKIRTGEIHLKKLMENIPDLVWLKTPQGAYLHCNHRFEQFFGVSEKEIVGKTDYDFVDKAQADFFRKYDRKAIKKGSQTVNEERVTFASDGHQELLETIKTPLYDDDGQLIGVLGIGRDITERKRAETALKQNQKLLSDVVDALPDMFWMKNPEGKYLLCNRKFQEFVNLTEEQIIGHTDHELFPKETADLYRKHDQIAIDNKKTTSNEDTAEYAAAGYSTWIETLKTPVYDEKKKLIGVLGIGRDISQRKEAMAESEARHQFLNMVLDHSPVPMWIGSPTGTTLKANKALYTALNLTPEQIVGKYNLLRDDNLKQPGIAEKIDGVLNKKQPVRFEVLWKSRSVQDVNFSGANDLYIDVSIFPILNKDGNIINIVVQWIDITDKKQAEEKLKKHNMELEQFNKMATGRELRMIELKEEINALCRELERTEPYT